MKNTIFILLLFILSPVYADNLDKVNLDFIQYFEKKCHYSFDDKIIDSIISHRDKQISIDEIEYTIFEFDLKIKLKEKITEAKLEFSCPSLDIEIPDHTPEQIIKEEDAGGRYFRNIAWQKEIYGNNWKGLVAFSDYIFGDSGKIKTYDFLICQKYSPCFSYSINIEPQFKKQEREMALDHIKSIRYLR